MKSIFVHTVNIEKDIYETPDNIKMNKKKCIRILNVSNMHDIWGFEYGSLFVTGIMSE